MFLHRAYLLPDYVTHTSLPKLFIRIRSVAVKFKGLAEPLYFTPDERRVCDVRDMVRMGGAIGCVIQLPYGEAEMNFHISAGWKQGLFQLWVHGYAGGFIPETKNDAFEVESWELYEYNLYAAPTGERRFPDLKDRPIDNYKTHDGIVVRDNNKYGLEIIERLKGAKEDPVEFKAAVDLASVDDDELVTTVILSSCRKVIGHLSFRETATVKEIADDLVEIVPIELWLGCEPEMWAIADFLVSYRKLAVSIPRIFNTKNFSTESSHCVKARSLFNVEDGVPKFKLLK